MAERVLELEDLHRSVGATFGTRYGWRVPRHYGDPAGEYGHATDGLGVLDRSVRGRLWVGGRAPAGMLGGMLTNRVPEPPRTEEPGVLRGRFAYTALLTPKGKMVADLNVFSLGVSEEEGFLLDVASAAVPGALSYFRRFLPPRMARVDDRTASTGMLTLLGAGAAAGLRESGLVPGSGGLPARGEFLLLQGGPGQGGVLVAGCQDVDTPAFDVIAGWDRIRELWDRSLGVGASPVGWGVWETLRVESGTPEYGADMGEGTIPLEVGLDHAFDHGKGCYTGQEVIVRIRHRGHVNWHLRRLRFGDGGPVGPGTELLDRAGRPVGRVTSVAQSPRAGEGIGLGMVRREIQVPGVLSADVAATARVSVEALPARSV